MKFGAVFPQTEIGTDPAALRDYAQGVEELGFDYLLAYEHILGAERAAYPKQSFIYDYEDSFHEPFTLFSYLAACTKKLEFTTGILVLPQREIALVAKQATQLSLLSDGRFRLGVGGGWNRAEATALGSDFTSRGKRMNEQLELLEELFTKPLLDYQGQHHNLKRVGLNPLPKKAPEIWVGGSADAVLKRAARFGHGWMPATLPAGDEQAIVNTLKSYVSQAGKDPDTFGIDARVVLAQHDEESQLAEFQKWKSLGATHFRCNTMGLGFTNPQQHLDTLADFLNRIA
jgi:probable F420-dependent oxidoreductase